MEFVFEEALEKAIEGSRQLAFDEESPIPSVEGQAKKLTLIGFVEMEARRRFSAQLKKQDVDDVHSSVKERHRKALLGAEKRRRRMLTKKERLKIHDKYEATLASELEALNLKPDPHDFYPCDSHEETFQRRVDHKLEEFANFLMDQFEASK